MVTPSTTVSNISKYAGWVSTAAFTAASFGAYTAALGVGAGALTFAGVGAVGAGVGAGISYARGGSVGSGAFNGALLATNIGSVAPEWAAAGFEAAGIAASRAGEGIFSSFGEAEPALSRIGAVADSEGGIANQILSGRVGGARAKQLADLIERTTGTKVFFNSKLAIEEGGNFFNSATNEIHLLDRARAVKQGVFFEEIQHALDNASGLLETLPSSSMIGTEEGQILNLQLHAPVFERMASNPWFQLDQASQDALRARAQILATGR